MEIKDLLNELEELKKIGEISEEELEVLSSSILEGIEKEALIKPLFGAQLAVTRAEMSEPLLAGLTVAPVLTGQQNIVSAVADKVIPMYGSIKSNWAKVKQDKANYGKIPGELFTPTAKLPKPEKLAADFTNEKPITPSLPSPDDHIKEIINGVGISLGSGALTYGAHHYLSNLNEDSKLKRGFGLGGEKALTALGKSTIKTLEKRRPLTAFVANVAAQAGNFADRLSPDSRLRMDFSTLENPNKFGPRKLGLYLGIAGGASLAEELFGNVIYDKLKEIKDKFTNKNENKVQGYKRQNQNRYSQQRQSQRPQYQQRQYRTASLEDFRALGEEFLEKEALNRDTQRLITEKMIRPAFTTGVTLTTLALLSRLLGRNLYGGYEKVRSDENIKVNKRIIVDVPSEELDANKNKRLIKNTLKDIKTVEDINKSSSSNNLLLKEADFIQDLQMLESNKREPRKSVLSRLKGVTETVTEPPTKLDKAKEKLDKKIQKHPKLKALDDLINVENHTYKGKQGLAHFLVEELPFKTVEGLAYAAPMVAAGVLLGRNLKRGLEPTEEEPGLPGVPEGTTRIIIQEKPDGGEPEVRMHEKKASIEDLKILQSHILESTIADDITDIQRINPSSLKGVVNGKKHLAEKLAGNVIKFGDPTKKINEQPFLEGAKSVTQPRNISPGLGSLPRNLEAKKFHEWQRNELANLLKKVIKKP